MRITLRASLFALAALTLAVTASCGGGDKKTDEGKPDVVSDLQTDVADGTTADEGVGDADRDVPPEVEDIPEATDVVEITDEGITD